VDGGDPDTLADAIRQLANSSEMVARLKQGTKLMGHQWKRFRAGMIFAISDLERACARCSARGLLTKRDPELSLGC